MPASAVYRFALPGERAGELSARDAGFAELPVKLGLEHRQGRQAHQVRPALMTLGNVFTFSHPRRERFLDRADCTP
jgi:hypothetical protein